MAPIDDLVFSHPSFFLVNEDDFSILEFGYEAKMINPSFLDYICLVLFPLSINLLSHLLTELLGF